MSNANETPAGAPAAGEGGNDAGDEEFELDDKGEPVLDENGKPKPKSGEGDGKDKNGNRRTPETPEAKRARLTRELAQHDKKHPPTAEPKPDAKDGKGELDYGQQAFLNSLDIKEDDEQELARSIMEDTGKTLKDVVKSNYFKSELKDLRDEKAAADALPSSKRTGQSSPSSVEYWIAKGQLPPNTPENRELRQKVVDARIKKEEGGSVFSKQAVVGRG